MRTTIDLPDDLLRALKVQAATRGESLKDVVTRAVSREIARNQAERRRVALPLVALNASPSATVTAEDIAGALDDDDARYAR